MASDGNARREELGLGPVLGEWQRAVEAQMRCWQSNVEVRIEGLKARVRDNTGGIRGPGGVQAASPAVFIDAATVKIQNLQERWSRRARPASKREREAEASPSAQPEDAALASSHPWEDLFDTLSAELNQKREQLRTERLQRKSMRSKSIKDPGRNITVVTTASLPWMTGTAVNPLLRAAYLAGRPPSDEEDDASTALTAAAAGAAAPTATAAANRNVTLLVPWLSTSDQARLFPDGLRFDSPDEQAQYVRQWVANRVGFEPSFRLRFYAGRYAPDKGSILPVGDIASIIPRHEADVAVLEEPEHLNWYHHGERWTRRFHHVVGIVHTNYLEYARREPQGTLKAAMLRYVNAWVCRTQCHKVVKLSGAVQELPRESTCFVHGVSPKFLEVGDEMKRRLEAARQAAAAAATSTAAAAAAPDGSPADENSAEVFTKGAYFIGKVLWGKGYTELVRNLIADKEAHGGATVPFDIYGSGPDLNAVRDAVDEAGLPMTFFGARDHGDASLHGYKVLVNPSLSDVVATTTAEALAMGKFVVVAKHPSNEFFSTFPNCIVFDDEASFSAAVRRALSEQPRPLSPEDRARLTWEAATTRFLDVADVDGLAAAARAAGAAPAAGAPSSMFARLANGAFLPFRLMTSAARVVSNATDDALAVVHNTLTGVEPIRRAMGAGKRTKQAPADLTAFAAEEHDTLAPTPGRKRRKLPLLWGWRPDNSTAAPQH